MTSLDACLFGCTAASGNAAADCELNLYGLSSSSKTSVKVRVEPKKKHGLRLDWTFFEISQVHQISIDIV